MPTAIKSRYRSLSISARSQARAADCVVEGRQARVRAANQGHSDCESKRTERAGDEFRNGKSRETNKADQVNRLVQPCPSFVTAK